MTENIKTDEHKMCLLFHSFTRNKEYSFVIKITKHFPGFSLKMQALVFRSIFLNISLSTFTVIEVIYALK